jgi:hypothetical protein
MGAAACPQDDKSCVDSPKTENGTDQQPAISDEQRARDAQVVQARQDGKLSDGTTLTQNEKTNHEQGFNASEDGTRSNPMQQICWTCSDGSSGVGGKFNTAALMPGESGGHTHPKGADGKVNPLPGPEDGALARATGQTAYVISSRGVFAIEKTPVGFRVRTLDGKPLSSAERKAVGKIVGAYNQNNGGSGKKCSYTSC